MVKARHKWGYSTMKGYVKCRQCGLEVKESDRKRGGLGPCTVDRWKTKQKPITEISPVILCPSCKKLVVNTIFCISCGHQLHELGWTPKGGV